MKTGLGTSLDLDLDNLNVKKIQQPESFPWPEDNNDVMSLHICCKIQCWFSIYICYSFTATNFSMTEIVHQRENLG